MEKNALAARTAQERNNAARKIQEAYRKSQAKKAAAEAARRAANNARRAANAAAAQEERAAKARAAFRRGGAAAILVAGTRAGAIRGQAAAAVTKKTFENFLSNWKIVGQPKNILRNVEKSTAVGNAQRFLNTRLQGGRNKAPQIMPHGSEWPNKHPWQTIVSQLNNYNLTNAQKNLIRRVNISVATQPTKRRFEVRGPVRLRGLNTTPRNQAIAQQLAVMKRQREEKEAEERTRANMERRAARASKSRGAASASASAPAPRSSGSRATYGMF